MEKNTDYLHAAQALVKTAQARAPGPDYGELSAAGVDVAELRDILTHTRAEATWRAYASDLRDYMRWANTADPFPMSPARLVAYLVDRGKTLAPTSLQRRMAAFRLLSLLHGHPDPTGDPLVRATLSGITRRRVSPAPGQAPWSPGQVPALAYPDLVKAVEIIDTSTPAGRRDRALLEVGFWAGFRVSEIAGLVRGRLTDTEDGIVITMTHAKQDQESGTAKYKLCPALPREELGTDPAGALRDWLGDLDEAGGDVVFRRLLRTGRVSRENRPLSATAIEQIVRRRLLRAQVPNAEKMTVHSLRAGYVTLARELDVPDIHILAQTHHNSVRTLDIYSRPDTAGARHPVKDLVARLKASL